MAERRMFTKKIIDSDAFLDMPLSAQSLYFHLNMRADDDGFVNNPRKIQRMIGASEDDLKLLLAKRFILGFDSGVIVIKHWRMHNLIRKDRYSPTQYITEKNELSLNENNAYTEKKEALATTWQPLGNQTATQYRLGKDSIEEDSVFDKIDKIDKSVPLHTPNALTKELIKAEYISECDIYIDDYNAFLCELIDRYSFEIVRSCLWYFIKRYKTQPTDEDGNAIENKVAYFRTAITSGAERLERENSGSFKGFGSFLYE